MFSMGRAISSAVERLVYTEDVGGSIPSSPTTQRGNLTRLVLAVVWIAAGIAAMVPAVASPFLFDAPGSESSLLTIALAAAVLLLPLLFIGGGILWLVLRRGGFLLLPILDVGVIAVLLAAIELACGGRLAC
jgi:hypothetical protein